MGETSGNDKKPDSKQKLDLQVAHKYMSVCVGKGQVRVWKWPRPICVTASTNSETRASRFVSVVTASRPSSTGAEVFGNDNRVMRGRRGVMRFGESNKVVRRCCDSGCLFVFFLLSLVMC